ncbi:MAG: hypothetical protein IT579_17695 [Verrucomicrobia subdivision 3 bacterium]|nr:hypothetical protein [Verrucomicrobiota bacterium]MCC6822567.1 hypothetical protein [Limisphaerales bacterium]
MNPWKMMRMTVLVSALVLAPQSAVRAHETNQINQLKRQLELMQENFEKVQRAQREQIEALTRQLNEVIHQQTTTTEQKKLEAQLALDLATNQPAATASANALEKAPWSPAQPLTVARSGASYLNLSFDGMFAVGGSSAQDIEALEFGGHDPKQNGFTVQNLEMTLDGKVDPYFKGQANIVLQIDPDGETIIEAEEAFLETISLPWNLQVKAGQYYTQFGRINPTHPHTWDFVDQPLVIGRFLGPDGLRNPGAQVSWLAPTPFYSELFLSVQNSGGETATSFRDAAGTELITQHPGVDTSVENAGDMLYSPRYVMSFDLGDEHTLVLGGSGAFGPNASGPDGRTAIYGADLFYKWKSRNHDKGFPFVTWQTEYLYSHYDAAAYSGSPGFPASAATTINNWGLYSQVSYGFRPRWVASLRGDYVTGQPGDFWANPLLDDRYRISPALTFFPSEFSKIRLQYNYDHIQNTGVENSVWFQFEFLLGAHSAHRF